MVTNDYHETSSGVRSLTPLRSVDRLFLMLRSRQPAPMGSCQSYVAEGIR